MIPQVKPPTGKQFKVKQSRYKVLDGVNPCRCIVLGGSGAGKDVLLTSWFTDMMRGAYEKIFWFSPSCDIDHQLVPLKKYVRDHLNWNERKDGPWCFKDWDESTLRGIMDQQKEEIEELKQNPRTHTLPGIAVVVNDFADRPDVTHRNDNPIATCFVRARHWGQSTYILSQHITSVAVTCRVNATFLIVMKLNNMQDIKILCEEWGALAGGPDNLRKIYEYAINDQPYSFLTVNVRAEPRKVFMLRFERYLNIEDVE